MSEPTASSIYPPVSRPAPAAEHSGQPKMTPTDAESCAVSLDRLLVMTSNARRLADDYIRFLGAAFVSEQRLEPHMAETLNLDEKQAVRCELALGGQRIDLIESREGRPYPSGSTATDLWFQHFAILVEDMDDAYNRLLNNRSFTFISARPVQLPASSGGVTAFKFRDFDGHPLEFLMSAPGTRRPEIGPHATVVPRVDHTALSVSDTTSTVNFLSHVLGLGPQRSTYNFGPEQATLDGLADSSVRVTQLQTAVPGLALELLDYNAGPRRAINPDVAAHDIASTHCVFTTRDLAPVIDRLYEHLGPTIALNVIQSDQRGPVVAIADPDHHRILVEEAKPSDGSPHGT